MKKTTIVILTILLVLSIALACFQQFVLSILTSHLVLLISIFSLIQQIYDDMQRIKTVQMIQSLTIIAELSKSFARGGEVSAAINETSKKGRDFMEQMNSKQDKKEESQEKTNR